MAALTVGGLVAGRLNPRLGRPALVAGLVAVLLVPAVWSTAAAANTQNGAIPAAGPAEGPGGGRPPGSLPGGMTLPGMPTGTTPFPGMGFPSPGPAGGPGGMFGGGDLTDDQRRIPRYAEQHGTAITLAVNGPSMMASSYIIDSDATVIGMGGFMGQLTGQGTDHMGQRHEWLEQHCTKVDPSTYGGSSAPPESAGGPMAAQTLYDCRS